MTMHLAIHRRIAVYTLKDMPKEKKTCQTDFTYARGLSGKSFPASCNNVENASQLHEVWQKGADENASTIRLN